ncbi:MAG: GNAT family N-acetyltransferase [Chitinophagaceae bacterium]
MIRLLKQEDAGNLFNYLTDGLSPQSKAWYAPHSFGWETVNFICNNLPGDSDRYVAIDEEGAIIAYMIIKKGMIDYDRTRLLMKNIYFDQHAICTFAPSVADAWQNSGLGSQLYDIIEKDLLETKPYKHIILWGGVNTDNPRAFHFYTKKGFTKLGSFWYDGKENEDMVKNF